MPIVEQTIYRHLGSDLGPSIPSQLLALKLLPHLDEIAAERRRRLRATVDAALDQLAEAIPDATVTRPDGGSVLWARFPSRTAPPRRSSPFATASVSRRGTSTPPARRPGRSCASTSTDLPSLVREGIDRLARAWRDLPPRRTARR